MFLLLFTAFLPLLEAFLLLLAAFLLLLTAFFAGYARSFRRLRTVIAPAEAKKGSHHARPDGGIWQLTLSLILMFNYYC